MEIPQLSLKTVTQNDMCYGCGKANPLGLKLSFQQDGEWASELVPEIRTGS